MYRKTKFFMNPPGFQITQPLYKRWSNWIFHLQFSPNNPTYLCDSIFLHIQEDICIFQGEDTLLHSYIWDNSWLHSHKKTEDFDITGYSLSVYVRHFLKSVAK